MKKFYFLVFGLFLGFCVDAQVINFPDNNLYIRLIFAQPNNFTAKDLNGNYVRIDQNLNSQIELSEAQNISALFINHISSNQPFLTDLSGIENFTNLRELWCAYNHINNLNLTNLTQLEYLNCSNNLTLSNLNVTNLANLNYLDASINSLSTLDVTGLNSIETINIGGNNFQSINFTSLSSLKKLDCNNNEISILEIENLSNLNELNCIYNSLSQISLNGLTNLNILDCSYNNLTSIDLAPINQLVEFVCWSNQFTSLNVSSHTNLQTLACGLNPITQLDCSALQQLQYLGCTYTSLTSLDLSSNSLLIDVNCSNSNLSNLILPSTTTLYQLRCNDNSLTSLDLSSCIGLYKIYCYNNQLTYLNTKNGTHSAYYNINFGGNFDLHLICADDFEIQDLNHCIGYYAGYTEYADVNSYCSVEPGGNYYTITGSTSFDYNNNGCDLNDIIYPNLKMNISNGTESSNLISNYSGDYSIFVGQGTHTITPILENQSYYIISPTSIELNFPTASNPSNQNFCISANGIHNDLEITLIPINAARPGFDARYRIVYKNKGNSVLSGSILFEFEDDKMDLVSSLPAFSSQSTGLLTFDYSNIQPFETREIQIQLNINNPQENPAVNNGDQLDFSAIINPQNGDEFLFDNTSSFKQTVVGSFDPNDKTCIEGTVVGPEMIGQYVHYVIRFENTGTFPAENIVVKDMIDLTKFDLSTLIPTRASHSYVTRIATDGKVEFIFENIQLPFDDANNDGYIAFKIKTLPSLVVGDTFSNNANIYFDYNFPIETNTATTSIQALGNSEFNFAEYITLYPNPVENQLNVSVKEMISITSINIYNSLGQLVLASTNPEGSVDVSSLKSGNYFIKLISDKGVTISQFIKE